MNELIWFIRGGERYEYKWKEDNREFLVWTGVLIWGREKGWWDSWDTKGWGCGAW